MAKETTYAGVQGDILHLLGALEANKEDLPQLEPFRLKLAGLSTQALDITQQQAALKASRQQASKDIRRILAEARRLANVLRTAIKEHYGVREEKIAEFGLQPFRGRKAKPVEPEKPAPTQPPPAVPAASVQSEQ